MTRAQRIAALKAAAGRRILIFDGAMGTMIQRLKLDEEAFRGERFASHGKPVKGNNDLLVLTQPEAIAEIHKGYLAASSDRSGLWRRGLHRKRDADTQAVGAQAAGELSPAFASSLRTS